MIEFCTARKMVLIIGILMMVTIFSVLIESNYEPPPPNHPNTGLPDRFLSSDNVTSVALACSETSNFTVEMECRQCTAWHQQKEAELCKITSYITSLKCENGEILYKSCQKPRHVSQRDFWLHLSSWFVAGCLSFVFVHFRRQSLDQKLLDRVNQQIAAGV